MKRNKIKQIAKKVISNLKDVSNNVEFKIGVDVEIVPKPCVRLFAHLYKLHKIQNEKVGKNGDSKSDNKSLPDNDEGFV